MLRRAAIVAVFLGLGLPLNGQLQEKHRVDGNQVRMLTRTVVLFGRLEEELAGAMQRRDQPAISALLAEDFELLTAEIPNDPTPREEWLRKATTSYRLESYELRKMSVREHGEFALVSFILTQRASLNGIDRSGDYFTVDLWQGSGDEWKLVTRFAAKAPPLPDTPAQPTGKE